MTDQSACPAAISFLTAPNNYVQCHREPGHIEPLHEGIAGGRESAPANDWGTHPLGESLRAWVRWEQDVSPTLAEDAPSC